MSQAETISIRIATEQKAMIDMAASILGKTRTSFILENALAFCGGTAK